MKHFEKKASYAGSKKGGGKPPPPKPPVLRPPKLGSYKIGASYQFSESVDLISDGPIEGFCNKFGTIVDSRNLLQSVYLNDVPVEESTQPAKTRVTDTDFEVANLDFTSRVRSLFNSLKEGGPGSLNYDPVKKRNIKYAIVKSSKSGKFKRTSLTEYDFNWNINLSTTMAATPGYLPLSYWQQVGFESYRNDNNLHKAYGKQNSFYTYHGSIQQNYNQPLYLNQRFFENRSANRIKDQRVNSVTGGFILDFQKTISRISQDCFRGPSQFKLQKSQCDNPNTDYGSCTKDYTENGNPKSADSVCHRGAYQIQAVWANQQSNKWEYQYLKKKLQSLNVKIPAGGVTFDFIKQIVSSRNGGTPQFALGFTGQPQENVLGPYMAFGFTGVIEGFTDFDKDLFVQDAIVRRHEIDFVCNLDDPKWNDRQKRVVNLLIPELNPESGEWNGKVKGFYLHNFEYETKTKNGVIARREPQGARIDAVGDVFSINMIENEVAFYRNVSSLTVYKINSSNLDSTPKYNYLNILAESRLGDGPKQQKPLSFFKHIYLDKDIRKALVGPFTTNPLQRQQSLINWTLDAIYKDANGHLKQRSLHVADKENTSIYGPYRIPYDTAIPGMKRNPDTNQLEWLRAEEEGSKDIRESSKNKFNFSDWNSYKENFDEQAQPITHVILNPNVDQCYVTFGIEALVDSLHRDQTQQDGKGDYLGSPIPGILNIRIEVGYISPKGGNEEGKFVGTYDRFFRIVSLIEGTAALDIGNPDNRESLVELNYVKEMYRDEGGSESNYSGGVGDPFQLPSAVYNDSYSYEELHRERYIRITKLSTEGNSTLITKAINVAKVTEIIPLTFNYPYSAFMATKLDSRTFGQIPARSYDARLKRVKIPSNYSPLNRDGSDKRYWSNANQLKNAGQISTTRVYNGDWDGTFKIGWTDNPAWILYDMLTSTRYGLGEHLKPENINKWQLYKIGRFCDAVDSDGYFVGVSDGFSKNGKATGAREARFTCNVFFDRGTKIYDALNLVCSTFRGMIYFDNSTVSFSDDMIKRPIMTFNNKNVVNATFNYSSLPRDSKYNAIEVSYVDALDGFKPKIEYVENEQDIIKRGLFKRTLNGFGVTSQSQAKRTGLHILYSAEKENETITFVAGLEGMLCKPGDLVIIDDDLKTLTSNFGKVLDVNEESGVVKLSERIDVDSNVKYLEDKITFLSPTGQQNTEELNELLLLKRHRYEEFDMSAEFSSFVNKKLNGSYTFKEYVSGYDDLTLSSDVFGIASGENIVDLQNQYAFYTGETQGTKHFLWYSTQYTGWVFSTGEAFTHTTTYDKYISAASGDQPYVVTRLDYFNSVNDNSSKWYKFKTADDGRDATESFNLYQDFLGLRYYEGLTDQDVRINETSQIIEMPVVSGSNNEYGSEIKVDVNDETYFHLPFVNEGSIYRFKTINNDNSIYKILTVTEQATNAYSIVANRFESGKYEQIEQIYTNETSSYADPYDSKYNTEGNTYFPLSKPGSVSWNPIPVVEGNETRAVLVGDWRKVANATGYRITLTNTFGGERISATTEDIQFDIDQIDQNGNYIIELTALGAVFDNEDFYSHYLDSDPVVTPVEVDFIPEDLNSDSSFVGGVIVI